MCWVVEKREGGLGDYQPGVYVPLKALFLVLWSLITCAIKLPPSVINIDFSCFGPYLYSESLSGH